MSEDWAAIPGLTIDGGEPVFSEPWEAQAFAMVVHLHAGEHFTWGEWAEALSAEIAGDTEKAYYAHWLSALERIVAMKGLTSSDALANRKDAWKEAAARTPHGAPITLDDPPRT